jgi:hypothetical protein
MNVVRVVDVLEPEVLDDAVIVLDEQFPPVAQLLGREATGRAADPPAPVPSC